MHLQNTPAQKKNVSSKNQQRRKISATNQSTQFQTSGNQLLQSTINQNYPHTIKKKSSKAKMALSGPSEANQVGGTVSSFPSTTGSNSISMTRTQTNKLQQQNYKGARNIFTDGPGEDPANDMSNNVFMQHENRLANTLNRGQQHSVQSNSIHQSLQMGENTIFV